MDYNEIEEQKRRTEAYDYVNRVFGAPSKYTSDMLKDKPYGTYPQVDKIVDSPYAEVAQEAVDRHYAMEKLIEHKNWHVRAAVAEEGYGIDKLVTDSNPHVRNVANGYYQRLGMTFDEWVKKNPDMCVLPENKVQQKSIGNPFSDAFEALKGVFKGSTVEPEVGFDKNAKNIAKFTPKYQSTIPEAIEDTSSSERVANDKQFE